MGTSEKERPWTPTKLQIIKKEWLHADADLQAMSFRRNLLPGVYSSFSLKDAIPVLPSFPGLVCFSHK